MATNNNYKHSIWALLHQIEQDLARNKAVFADALKIARENQDEDARQKITALWNMLYAKNPESVANQLEDLIKGFLMDWLKPPGCSPDEWTSAGPR